MGMTMKELEARIKYLEEQNNQLQIRIGGMEDSRTNRIKILVLGESIVSVNELCKCIKYAGFDKNQIEFRLGYDAAKSACGRVKQYDNCYTAVIVGPLPHKVEKMGDYESLISKWSQEEGYPHLEKAVSKTGELKLNKRSFQTALENVNHYLELDREVS